jgi:hypothetical protein
MPQSKPYNTVKLGLSALGKNTYEELYFTKYQNGPIKEDKMGRACRTHRGDEICKQNFNLKTRREEVTW